MKSRKLSKKKKNDYLWGYIMIAPLVIGLSVFFFYPFFKVVIDSFKEVGAFNKSRWVGLDNYIKMMQDQVMWRSLGNTVKYVLIIVPLTMIFSILIAVLLNKEIKGKSLFRVIYFIPTITMAAAVAMIWRWIYNGDYGILNYILGIFGIRAVNWLTNPNTVLIAVSIVAVWMNVGYNMIILLAGIQGISKTYYEAAAIDGAGGIQQFWKITLPLVTPTLFFVLITTLISTFQTFDVVYMMIDNRNLALESAQSIVVYFYRNAFVFSKKGYASAIAILLFIIIMIVTLIQMKLQKKWVNYE